MNKDLPMAEMTVIRIIQGKITQITKIIKHHLRKTKKIQITQNLWVETKGIKGNKHYSVLFIFCCVVHAFVLELWQIV